MASRRSRNSRALAIQSMELAFATPQVVAHRFLRIAGAGSHPSARDWSEFYLMSAEKVAAFTESWNAILWELFRANLALTASLGPSFWLRSPFATRWSRATRRHFERTALAVLAKGVAPVHRRAVANMRRLGRRSCDRSGR
jgi:hypothetical protein